MVRIISSILSTTGSDMMDTILQRDSIRHAIIRIRTNPERSCTHYDSYACQSKGIHKAVERLRTFTMLQISAAAWFLGVQSELCTTAVCCLRSVFRTRFALYTSRQLLENAFHPKKP